MKPLTREELAALVDACEIAARTLGRSAAGIVQDGTEDAARGRREGKAAAELLTLAADRLRTYPLPAAEGEREEAAAELLESARDFSTAIDNGIDDRDDVKIQFIMLSDAEQRCRRAAALLRAPAGVDREAVLDLVEHGRLHGSHGLIGQAAADQACDELLAVIRALPEAKALQPYGYGIVDADGKPAWGNVCAREAGYLLALRGERVVRLFWTELREPAKPR